MGHIGMKYSLVTRDLIADSTECMAQAHQFDALVMVPNCYWTGDECDLLVVRNDLRLVDVEVKISRSDLKADAGKGMIVISSELPELLGICDRIYTLSYGRITGVVDRADATQELLMTYMTMEKDGPAA